ncbi:unnamed protein product [Hanseniaspora opuntiae]
MDGSLENTSTTPVLTNNKDRSQPSSDHSLSSDKTIDEPAISESSKLEQKKPKLHTFKWQDRTQLSKHVDSLVGNPIEKALLKEIFFPISEDDLKERRKRRSPVKTVVPEEKPKVTIKFDHQKQSIDNITGILDDLDKITNERLITTKEAEIKKTSNSLENVNKPDLKALIQNYERQLKYKTKLKDVENLSIKDQIGAEYLSNLEIKILQRKAELKNIVSTTNKYKNLKSTISINKLFKDFVNKHGDNDAKLLAKDMLILKGELDSMNLELKKLYECETKFFHSMLKGVDSKVAKASLVDDVSKVSYPGARAILKKGSVKREAPVEEEITSKPVKKQKKVNSNTVKKSNRELLLEKEKQAREEYEQEVSENFMESTVISISSENPLFYNMLSDIPVDDVELINFYDVLGKTAPSSNSRYSSATVNVVVSALFPNKTEKYIIHSSNNVGTRDNFSIDSLMVIYDLMQLNNIIYINRKIEPLNDLLYSFYKELCIRSKKTRFDPSRISVFVDMINQYNDILQSSKMNKRTMLKNANDLYIKRKLPKYFCNFICNYVYGRIVIPEAKKLSKYVGFSDKTYGELLPDFLSMVFDKCQLGYNSNFVDLGSGIGNTNYFASLIGNVSSTFGCEIMENPSDLCVKYGEYFRKIMKLFGINIHSEYNFSLKRSFINNEDVVKNLKQCDVLLLNNFIFSGDINIEATNLINNLPIGAKVIHLKPLMTMNKAAVSRVTKARIDYNVNKMQEIHNIVEESSINRRQTFSKTGVVFDEKKTHYLKDAELDDLDRVIRDSLRIKNEDGSLNETLNQESDNLVEVTRLILDDKMLVSLKYAMPSGDMVSWTSDNDWYSFYISKVVDLSALK